MKKINVFLISIFLMLLMVSNIEAANYECDKSKTVCAKLESGKLSLYGNNYSGRLGVKDTVVKEAAPVIVNDQLPPDSKITLYRINKNNVFVILSNGTVYASGKNDFGQLGIHNNADSYKFIKNSILTKYKVKSFDWENPKECMIIEDNTKWISFYISNNNKPNWIIIEKKDPFVYSLGFAERGDGESTVYDLYWMKTN